MAIFYIVSNNCDMMFSFFELARMGTVYFVDRSGGQSESKPTESGKKGLGSSP